MNGDDGIHAFNLEDDHIIHDQVNAIPKIDLLSFINNWQPNLAFNDQSLLAELMQ